MKHEKHAQKSSTPSPQKLQSKSAVQLRPSIILDTNVIISGVLFKGRTIRNVMNLAFAQFQVVFSPETWDELAFVFQRPFFEKHLALDQRLTALATLAEFITMVESTTQVFDCRDPKDNKFLALAIDAQVKYLVTGDLDLLALHPYHGINIVTPTHFIESHQGTR